MAKMRTEVFNGWVELRDPDLVPERLRRPVFEKSIKASQIAEDFETDPTVLSFFSELNDVLAVALISAWSFGDVITVDTLQDLPARTYDDVRKAVSPLISRMIPDFGDDVIDPKATTAN
jgi:hypothetical protein